MNFPSERIDTFIKSHFVLVLAVAQTNSPYASTIFYATPDAHNLYFKSRTASNHSRIIQSNPRVAAAIYDHDSNYMQKAGIQLLGTVERVVNLREVVTAIALYSEQFQGAGDKLKSPEALISGSAESAFYRLTVTHVKIVDVANDLLISDYESW